MAVIFAIVNQHIRKNALTRISRQARELSKALSLSKQSVAEYLFHVRYGVYVFDKALEVYPIGDAKLATARKRVKKYALIARQ